jgi:hypothetical protein
VLSLAVLIVLWIALPFSVFGTKDLIKKTIQEQEKTNRLLSSILEAGLSVKKSESPERTDRPGDHDF